MKIGRIMRLHAISYKKVHTKIKINFDLKSIKYCIWVDKNVANRVYKIVLLLTEFIKLYYY